MDRMKKFLNLVTGTNWRQPPAVWNEELRTALSNGLVKVGWGGILEVTGEGDIVRDRPGRDIQ